MIGHRSCTRETHSIAASAISAAVSPCDPAAWRIYTTELLKAHAEATTDMHVQARAERTLAALECGEVNL